MALRARTRRNLAPVVGGVTAVATATGAMALVTQVMPANAAPDSPSAPDDATGVTGALQGCEAYFGFGKHVEVAGVVDFDVFDLNGDDPTEHDVDTDTQVALILENEEGDTLECIPFEITEDMWEEADDETPIPMPDFPGPGHFAYPSPSWEPFIDDDEEGDDDFGEVVAVRFRVTEIPGGEHTLVSPEGEQELTDFFINPEDLEDGLVIDERVTAYITSELGEDGAAAATAFSEAVTECGEENPEIDGTDEDLLAALDAIAELFGENFTDSEADCSDVEAIHFLGSIHFSWLDAVAYVEEITLELPEEPEAPPAAEPPAAQPAELAPTFTG